ncbi:50S ribosomal protein L20 [Candidatus Dojkabacteria bacterium]|nr:50S ribosomal protein L20 [Candidatus Dojkabacteria bacterium]
MRVKGGYTKRRKHKKILSATKGYRMTKNRLYKVAHEAYMHAGQYSFRDRQRRGAQARRVWIERLNAALKAVGLKYSTFMSDYSKAGFKLNRKILSELAATQPAVFEKVVAAVK